MKRIAAAIICIVLFVMAPCAALASDTPNTLSENEAMYDSPRDVAISFLNDCAYEMFMYESKGLSNKTVLMLSNNDLVTANARFLSEFANRPASFDYWSISSVNFQNSLESSMDFVLNKVSYFKTIRADQNITRKNFETQYTVKKAVQEGDFCTIYINEFISFQYENRNTPSYVSTDYEVYLYQYNGEWLIANVIADDEFDRNFRAYGFDATEAIGGYYYAKDNPSNSQGSIVSNLNDANNALRSNVVSTRTYNRTNARAYAYTYTTQGYDPYHNFYNSLFTSWAGNGGDCQNFASQSIWAGFGGSNDAEAISNKEFPMDNVGSTSTTNWTGNSVLYNTWISTSSFENYINNSSSAQDTRMSAIILDFESTDNEISGVEVGDVMHVYNSSTHRSYDHAIVITDVFSANRNDIYFCAHTTDRKDLKVSDYYPVGTYGELRLIKPMLFTIVTNCPNGSHTYSSVSGGNGFDAVCNSCGYNRLFITNNMHAPLALGTTANLTATATGRIYRFATSVETPSGQIIWLNQTIDSPSTSNTFTFEERGLYTITTYARDKNPDVYSDSVSVSNSYTVRIY